MAAAAGAEDQHRLTDGVFGRRVDRCDAPGHLSADDG